MEWLSRCLRWDALSPNRSMMMRAARRDQGWRRAARSVAVSECSSLSAWRRGRCPAGLCCGKKRPLQLTLLVRAPRPLLRHPGAMSTRHAREPCVCLCAMRLSGAGVWDTQDGWPQGPSLGDHSPIGGGPPDLMDRRRRSVIGRRLESSRCVNGVRGWPRGVGGVRLPLPDSPLGRTPCRARTRPPCVRTCSRAPSWAHAARVGAPAPSPSRSGCGNRTTTGPVRAACEAMLQCMCLGRAALRMAVRVRTARCRALPVAPSPSVTHHVPRVDRSCALQDGGAHGCRQASRAQHDQADQVTRSAPPRKSWPCRSSSPRA